MGKRKNGLWIIVNKILHIICRIKTKILDSKTSLKSRISITELAKHFLSHCHTHTLALYNIKRPVIITNSKGLKYFLS